MSTWLERRITSLPSDARLLGIANLVNAMGSGLYLPVAVIYFTTKIGLSTASVAAVFSIGAVIALLAGPKFGQIADRVDAVRMHRSLQLLQAFLMTLLFFASNIWIFGLLNTLISLAQSAAGGSRGKIIGEISSGPQRVKIRAFLRSTGNLGLAIGSAAGGMLLALSSGGLLQWFIILNALSWALAAVPLKWLSRRDHLHRSTSSRHIRSVRDFRYLCVAAACGLLNIHFEVLSFLIPLWVVTRTDASAAMVSALFLTNTVIVVTLQVWASRFSSDIRSAARSASVSGIFFAIGCVIMAFTAETAGANLSLLLFGAIILHSVGEIIQVASGFTLSFDLTPEGKHGEYQSTFAAGRYIARIIGPPLLALVVVRLGGFGWFLLAILFLAAGLLVSRVTGWAARNRA